MKPLTTSINPPKNATHPSKYTRLATRYLTLDTTIDSYFTGKLQRTQSPVIKALLKPVKSLATMLTSYDFSRFINSKTPRARIAEPPLGALMIMMYVGLLGARAARGWQRGKPPVDKPNAKRDLREMFDVFRRDLWGITFYIFGFGVLNSLLVKRAQKKQGILLQNKSGAIHTFSDHDINASITNKKVLQAHLSNGNRNAVFKAANHNSYFGLPAFIKKYYPSLQKNITHNIHRFRSALHSDKLDVAMKHLKLLDADRKAFIQQQRHQNTMTSKELNRLKRAWPKYQNFLSRYLKHRRIPMDVTSFVLLFMLIGYGPIWLNKVLTEYQYREKYNAVPI